MDATAEIIWLDEWQAAEHIGVSRKTLANWRSRKGHSLPYYRHGRKPRYLLSEVDAWLLSQRVDNTSSPVPRRRRSNRRFDLGS